MEVGLLAVVEVSVWFPDTLQHGDAKGQGVLVGQEGEPPVHPRLSEVTVHRVRLSKITVFVIKYKLTLCTVYLKTVLNAIYSRPISENNGTNFYMKLQ